MATKIMATEAEKKLVRIVDRIMEHYQDEIYEKRLKNDSIMCNLNKDLDKATKENRFLSQAIIRKQMLARIKVISNEYAAKKIQSIANSGELGAYLDDDDHKKYEELRLKMFFIYEALDYILADMTSFFHGLGFTEGEVNIFREVVRARDAISDFGKEATNIKGSFAEDIIETEAERVYKFVCRRFPYAEKQIQKAYEKSQETETTNN